MRGEIISELGDPDKRDICHLPGPALIKEKCHGKKRYSQNHPAVLESCSPSILSRQKTAPDGTLSAAKHRHSQAEPKQGRFYVKGNGGTSPTWTFMYLDMFLLVPTGCCINAVKTWSQEHVEIATFLSVHPQAFIQNNGSFKNCPATLVLDNAMHSLVDLKQSI